MNELIKESFTVRENLVPVLKLVGVDYGVTSKVTAGAGEVFRAGVRYDGLHGYKHWEDRVSPGCVLVSIKHPRDLNIDLFWGRTFSVGERIERRLANSR